MFIYIYTIGQLVTKMSFLEPIVYNLMYKYNNDVNLVLFELNQMLMKLENTFGLGDFHRLSRNEILNIVENIVEENKQFEICDDIMDKVFNMYVKSMRFELEKQTIPGNGDCLINAVLIALDLTHKLNAEKIREKFAKTVFFNDFWLTDFVETTFQGNYEYGKKYIRSLGYENFSRRIMLKSYFFDEVGLNFLENLLGFTTIVFNHVPNNNDECVVQWSRASMIGFSKETLHMELTPDTRVVFLLRTNCNHIDLLHSKYSDKKCFLLRDVMESPYGKYIHSQLQTQ